MGQERRGRVQHSEVAAKKAAADAVFGKEAGLAGEDLTDFSKNLVELAAICLVQ